MSLCTIQSALEENAASHIIVLVVIIGYDLIDVFSFEFSKSKFVRCCR